MVIRLVFLYLSIKFTSTKNDPKYSVRKNFISGY